MYQEMFQQVKNQWKNFANRILKQKYAELHGKRMRFQYFLHGNQPVDGYRLVFGWHGGGGCPFQVNQQQWNNHKHLYDGLLPPGTIWFVPRSPQQAPDMWWKDYIPQMTILIIQCFSVLGMIDNNRVFITGYSAGGDGIYHVASMMADFLAGAAMMAGHPNKADVCNLRNIAFSVQVGQNDHAYDRANWGKVYKDKICEYSNQFGGFKQYSHVHGNQGHWMQKKDAQIFPQFFNEIRQPYPQFILFKQHQRTFKKTFYYIRLQQKHKGVIAVRRKGNLFQIQSNHIIPIRLMLNSYFIDFKKQVQVYYNGSKILSYLPKKNMKYVKQSIEQFMDPWYIFEDEIICLTQTNLPRDYRIFRPYQMQKYQSSLQKIVQMQNNIIEDENLHVSFKKQTKDQKGQENEYEHQQIHYKIIPKHKKSKHHIKSKDPCQNCQII